MSNSTCPICGARTEGKAVRRVNFCKVHAKFAAFVRDQEAVKKHEAFLGRSLYGALFAKAVKDVIREAERQGLKVVGA